MSAGFDRWVGSANGAMIAVTAAVDDAVDACLVGFHSQCSIEPPRYAVWLSEKNHTFRLARRAGLLGVHLLSAAQRPLAVRLGAVSADDTPAKLDGIPTRRHRSGAVLLGECAAWFVGEVTGQIRGGDHRGFVVEPIATGRRTVDTPLRLADVIDIDPGHEP